MSVHHTGGDMTATRDSFKTRTTLSSGGKTYAYYSIERLAAAGFPGVRTLPYVHKILLENLLRCEDGVAVSREAIEAVARWDEKAPPAHEINFTPARVLLQDFTGVPAVVDLAAMRDAVARLGGDPSKINPLFPVELVVDHSVQVDSFGRKQSIDLNTDLEYQRNAERYAFLRWGQNAFRNFRVVPPATGIVHQVNLEYLARVVFERADGPETLVYPDTLVGTDSHTPMVNGLGVLAWGVGGIEAEAAMLGQPITLLVPQVVGVRLAGVLPEGATATDLVLTATERLRKLGVVGKFVEFFGPGLAGLALADRATLGNMAPEYGATCAVAPIDAETLRYLQLTGRGDRRALVEAYARAQGMFAEPGAAEARYSQVMDLDLAKIEPSVAGPKLPHTRIPLGGVVANHEQAAGEFCSKRDGAAAVATKAAVAVTLAASDDGGPATFELADGAVVIAAITSCTNTSNPSVMIAAGLLAKKAVERGLTRKPWVKTSLAPGSLVVTRYLTEAGLLPYLERLGFNVVGYGCTTCIGNSGPLPAPISRAILNENLYVAAVLSGNRNFEGRVSPQTRANYLASPPLVVAYALAGTVELNLTKDPLGVGKDGASVYLKDIWPSQHEISDAMAKAVKPAMFESSYAGVFKGEARWNALPAPTGDRFTWSDGSSYIRQPTFFEHLSRTPPAPKDIVGARALAVLGDSVTTDHISPAGDIEAGGPAAQYLQERGISKPDFNSYGSRRGNHEVMIRGTFANIRLKNALAGGKEGGWTRHLPTGEVVSIYEASVRYRKAGTPLVVLAGAEYGTGSSRDWAAKGPALLGIACVIAQSFERIHRSNLIGMGVLPLEYTGGQTAKSLGLTGEETFEIVGLASLVPGRILDARAVRADGKAIDFRVKARIDTPVEALYYKHGGILHYVLRQLL